MKKKRVVGLILAAALVAATVGCGSQGSSNGDGATGKGNSDNAGNSVSNEERVPIRWLTTGDSAAAALQDGDRIVEAINEKLGIDLQVEIVPEGNVEKVNVAMASGDFPDVVTGAYGTSATQQWIEDGMVIPLNQYFETSPNMKKWLEEVLLYMVQ